MDDTAAALMRFQSETNARLTEFASAVSKLSETVSTLAGSVQAQVASSVGFKELYEMQVKNLERADTAIKDLLTAKISAVERMEKAIEKAQNDIDNMKPFSTTVTTLMGKVLALETYNLTISSKVEGARTMAKVLWGIGYFAFTAAVSAVTYYLAHFR